MPEICVSSLRWPASGQTRLYFFAGDIGPSASSARPFPGRRRASITFFKAAFAAVSRSDYRTSHQIRCKSDQLLPPRSAGGRWGGEDNRLGVSSVFHGPAPNIHVFVGRLRI